VDIGGLTLWVNASAACRLRLVRNPRLARTDALASPAADAKLAEVNIDGDTAAAVIVPPAGVEASQEPLEFRKAN
jgi:hypothetical protein